MFAPIILNVSEEDAKTISQQVFVAFRKTLKNLLKNEFYDIFGEVTDESFSKNIFMSIKEHTTFDGNVVKHARIRDPTKCGSHIAEVVFAMFQMLCSLQIDYDVKKHIKVLAGIINDAGRGLSAMERIVFAMNMIYDLSSNHEIFDIVQDSVTDIEKYLNDNFECEIEVF